jgi:hypothetical protein
VYQCKLPLSTNTVTYVANLLRGRLKEIRSRWRSLPPGRITVIVLALLRHDQRAADLAGGNQLSESTVWRWRDEVIRLLAAKAAHLDPALNKIAARGGQVVLIDGTPIPTRRRTGPHNRTNYPGKHRTATPLAGQRRRPRALPRHSARPNQRHPPRVPHCRLTSMDRLLGTQATGHARNPNRRSSTGILQPVRSRPLGGILNHRPARVLIRRHVNSARRQG